MDQALPLYLGIQRELEARIRSGEWRPGHRVPGEHELLGHYGCSRMTVNRALSNLAAAGLIVRRRRSGSFVAPPRAEETVLAINDLKAEVEARGQAYRPDIRMRRERPATATDALRLGVAPGTPILALTLLHLADGEPHALEERLINLRVVPAAREVSFRDLPPGSWLLQHVPWTEAEHSIRAVRADARIAGLLRRRPGLACLVIDRRTLRAGAAIACARLTYPGDRHSFSSRLGPP
ncbi:MAG: GntR family transcriptional regulator [Rubritepida sp.]|nr:GntR family transcriptional regulator [Rubritepida sp.]